MGRAITSATPSLAARPATRAGLLWHVLAAVSGVAVGLASPASSQAPVELTIDPCLGVDAEDVRRIVSLELALELEAATVPEETTMARALCEDDGARLEVDDPTTGKSSSRRVVFQVLVGGGRARLLALALAELIAASWAEHRLTRASAAHDRDATASTRTRTRVAEIAARRFVLPPPRTRPETPAHRAARGRTFLTAGIGVAAAPAHLVGGGSFELLFDAGPRLSLGTSVDLLQGRARSEAGAVLDHRLGFSGLATLRQPVRRSWISFGLGGRVGRALLRGAAADGGRSVAAPFAGVYAVGHAWRQIVRVLLVARLEVGLTTAALRGRLGDLEGPVVAAVDGPWGSFSLGIGLTL